MAPADDIPDDATNRDEPVSDEELAEPDRPHEEVLGIESDFAPDEMAPPVDERRLLAFVQGQLTGDDQDEIIDMISAFRRWRDAWHKVLERIDPPKSSP